MKKATIGIGCLLLLLSPLVLADQLEEVQFPVSTISRFVNIESDLNFSSMLPGHVYEGMLNISWAIPNDALKGVKEKEVEVFFSMVPRNSGSVVKFGWQNATMNRFAGSLKCIVENGRCGAASRLSERVMVKVTLDEEGKKLVEAIVINATMKPVGIVEEAVEQRKQVVEEIRKFENEAKETPVENASESVKVQGLVEQAKADADRLNADEARKGLADARDIQKAGQKKNGLFEGTPIESIANSIGLGNKVSPLFQPSSSNFMWIVLGLFLLLATIYVIARVARKIGTR